MAGKSQYRGIAGMNRLRRILGRMPPETTKDIKGLVGAFAKDTEMSAKLYATRGKMASRRYAQAIGHKMARSGLSADVGVIGARAKKLAWFAHFIEFGTKAGVRVWKGQAKRQYTGRRTGSFKHPGTPRRPVLKPAFELHRVSYLPKFGKAIDDALKRTAMGADDS